MATLAAAGELSAAQTRRKQTTNEVSIIISVGEKDGLR